MLNFCKIVTIYILCLALKEFNMIRKLKENWFIFKNAKDKFNRDKSYASELVEKSNHLKSITKEAWIKNGKFEDFINEAE